MSIEDISQSGLDTTSEAALEENASSFCYFLVCYDSVEFVSFLLASVYHSDDLFFIHCDIKAPYSLKSYVGRLSTKFSNVFVLESRNYSWAGYSHVQLSLEAIRLSLNRPMSWSHMVFLSEQHLPLMSRKNRLATVASKKTIVKISSIQSMGGEERLDVLNRFAVSYRELPGVGCFAARTVNRPSSFLDTIFHGSNWFVLFRDHCLILDAAARRGDFSDFENSLHAEECAIQTILGRLGVDIHPQDPTLVAQPASTDNHSLIMTSQLYLENTASNFMFIRKRTKILDQEIVNIIRAMDFTESIYALRHARQPIRRLFIKSTRDQRKVVRDSLIKRVVLLPHVARVDYIDPDKYDMTPSIHLIVAVEQLVSKLTLRILSEDLVNYKVCILAERPFGPFQIPFTEAGYLVSTIRARVFGIFCYAEFTPVSIPDAGFISLRFKNDNTPLVELVASMLNLACCLPKPLIERMLTQ